MASILLDQHIASIDKKIKTIHINSWAGINHYVNGNYVKHETYISPDLKPIIKEGLINHYKVRGFTVIELNDAGQYGSALEYIGLVIIINSTKEDATTTAVSDNVKLREDATTTAVSDNVKLREDATTTAVSDNVKLREDVINDIMLADSTKANDATIDILAMKRIKLYRANIDINSAKVKYTETKLAKEKATSDLLEFSGKLICQQDVLSNATDAYITALREYRDAIGEYYNTEQANALSIKADIAKNSLVYKKN